MSPRGRSCWVLAVLVLSAGMGRAEERKNQVVVEVKYIALGNECVERLKQQHLLAGSRRGQDIAFLDTAQVLRLLNVVQEDIRSNVMQAPKMTMFDGQSTTFQALDEQHITKGATIVLTDYGMKWDHHYETISLGVQLSLRSKIATDRRSWRVDLDTQLTNLDESEPSRLSIKLLDKRAKNEVGTEYDFDQPRVVKMGVKRTLSIPVGKSAVLAAGMRINQVVGPECLKEVPLLREWFCITETHPEVEQLFVMVTPYIALSHEKEEKQSHANAFGESVIRQCCRDEVENDSRTTIIPPPPPAEPMPVDPPGAARILQALPQLTRLLGVYEESRDNYQFVTECIVDKLDPPRFFPLIGPAQLRHCCWKCSVYYLETVAGSFPLLYRWSQPCLHLVFLNSDHLHVVSSETPHGK